MLRGKYFLGLFLPLLARGLDLTPTPGLRELESFSVPVVYFSDQGKQVTFQPPAGWALVGRGSRLVIAPQNQPEVEMIFCVYPVKTPKLSAPPEDLEVWSRQFLPKALTETPLASQAIGTFVLHRNPCHEFTYTYAEQARRFTRMVAIVELSSEERFTVIVTARAADFKATRDQAIRSLFSMTWPD